jgi:hypothetical protein
MQQNNAKIIGVVGLDGNGTVILNAEMNDQEIKLLLQHVLTRLDQHAGARNLVR